ncbi:MAG TPA: TatD family hydrolase [Candidatus Krumholzibacteria bacterium]|nr:TatD family hydrolase [Candidatus Krumholzibacteria bacterium]
MAGLIDSHLHLGREEFDSDRESVRARARDAGVCAFLHVGFDPPSIEAALRQAEGRKDEWVAAGIHPHDAREWSASSEKLLEELAKAGRIVAVGECGLDFYRDLSPRPLQERAFRAQIALAKALEFPMIYHVRDAYPEAKRILLEEGLPPRRGIFHAFAGDAEFAAWAKDEGFLLGVGGPLTYPKSKLPEAIEKIPRESLILETDAPWLPPQPFRGRRNEPAYLRITAEHLALAQGVSVDELARGMAESFASLFGVEFTDTFDAFVPSCRAIPKGRAR